MLYLPEQKDDSISNDYNQCESVVIIKEVKDEAIPSYFETGPAKRRQVAF